MQSLFFPKLAARRDLFPVSAAILPARLRILFVDDEEKSRKYFAMIFGKTWDVVLAADGAEGLDLVLGKEGGRIGVIVTDQIMPRLSGIGMLERVRELRPGIVRVLSAGDADSEPIVNAAKSGVIDCLVEKPWRIVQLHQILEQATAHHHRIRVLPAPA